MSTLSPEETAQGGAHKRPLAEQHSEYTAALRPARNSRHPFEHDGQPPKRPHDRPRKRSRFESPPRKSSTTTSFLTLPFELRGEVYEHLAIGPVFTKRALCSVEELGNLRTPPVLLLNKAINKECTEMFNKRVPFSIDLPIKIRPDYLIPATCPKLDIAFPRETSGKGDTIAMPARNLSLKITLDTVSEWWENHASYMPYKQIISSRWFKELRSRLQACPNLTDLSIRWCLPSPPSHPPDKALHVIFNDLVETVESMPELRRYSVQIGYNASEVSTCPRWGLAILSAYGRKGTGKQWDDETTVRYCCQEMPCGEWYDLLFDLRLDPMCPSGCVTVDEP